MSTDTKELVVEWAFAGGWLLLLAIGALVSWRTSTQPHQSYRGFVPFIGLVTAFLLAATIVLGSSYYPN